MDHKWKPQGYFRLFISHISEHHEFAGLMSQWALRYGISCFVAHQDIDPTAKWQDTIESALGSMNALVALMHPGFHKSKWCDQEVGFAIGSQKLVISVRLGADPHGFIGKYQAVSGAAKSAAEVATELANCLAVNPATSRAMARGAVRLFSASNTWAESKRIIGFLETIPSALPKTIARLEEALKANSQIKEAWGVPERVNALVQKWQSAV